MAGAGGLDVTPPPGEEGTVERSPFSLGAMEGEGEGRLGNLIEAGANPGLVPAGFDLRGGLRYESLNYEFTFQSNRDAFSMFYGNDGGRIAATFSEAEIDYAMSATRHESADHGHRDPRAGRHQCRQRRNRAAHTAGRLARAADALGAACLIATSLMGDGIWGMFDPAQAIPRDPRSAWWPICPARPW